MTDSPRAYTSAEIREVLLEDDKDYHIRNGENWIEPGTVIDGGLHDGYYKREDCRLPTIARNS